VLDVLCVSVGLRGPVRGLSHMTSIHEMLHSSTTMHRNVGRWDQFGGVWIVCRNEADHFELDVK